MGTAARSAARIPGRQRARHLGSQAVRLSIGARSSDAPFASLPPIIELPAGQQRPNLVLPLLPCRGTVMLLWNGCGRVSGQRLRGW